MTPKQRAHEAINILYTQRSHTQVFMITEEVYGVPLSKKLTFDLTLFPSSPVTLLWFSNYFFGKHKARRIIKELYETVEPNQYARSKSMLPRVLNTIIGKQQPTVSDNLSPNHYRID